MSENITGYHLTQAFQLVSAVGKEIDALILALDGLFEEKIHSTCKTHELFDYEVEDCYLYHDGGDWVLTSYANAYPLRKIRTGRGKRKSEPEVYLGYQISLSGEGTLTELSPEPLLHVYCRFCTIDFDENLFIGGVLMTEYSWMLDGNSLIRWLNKQDNTLTGEWAFSLRLTSLNSIHDLEEKIVKPAIALLNGEPGKQSLPENMPGLVKYRKEAERLVIT